MRHIINPFLFLRLGLIQQLYLFIYLILPTSNTQTMDTTNMFENINLPTVEIIQNNGYTAEIHYVTTNDGYILELHRIPKSKNGQKPTKNHPVIIHHGILGSSADWVLGGANISLPMQLADEGYDVWLANCRGNTYSRKHVSLSYKQRAFWNFSLHEIGTYDLPAAFDYILLNTSKQQLHYVGYSMGTCVFYIMASERPEYQSKIRSQISLAPVAYMSNTRSPLKYIAPYAKIINIMYQKMMKGMLLPQSKLQQFLASTVCREKITQKLICEKYMIFSVCGSDPHYFDSNLIPLIMGHFPAGTSSKLATHFAQFILKDSFCQYDYGPTTNLKYYNSSEPPKYKLKSIKVPITLIYGENDILSEVKDVMKLKNQLPKLMDAFPVNNVYCNHVDFLWSTNVTENINDPIKNILRTTDDQHWKYSGPNPAAFDESRKKTTDHVPLAVRPVNDLKFVPGLDFIVDNMDTIISDAMPRTMDDCDAAEFEQERQIQKVLFGGLIDILKSAEKNYVQRVDGFTNDITDWTDDVTFGVFTRLNDVRNMLEDRAEKTSVLINDQLSTASKSTVNGISMAENSVSYGVKTAEKFVVSGVKKAEQSVVKSVTKTNDYMNYGVSKAKQAVGNAMNTTFKALNKVFRFMK